MHRIPSPVQRIKPLSHWRLKPRQQENAGISPACKKTACNERDMRPLTRYRKSVCPHLTMGSLTCKGCHEWMGIPSPPLMPTRISELCTDFTCTKGVRQTLLCSECCPPCSYPIHAIINAAMSLVFRRSTPEQSCAQEQSQPLQGAAGNPPPRAQTKRNTSLSPMGSLGWSRSLQRPLPKKIPTHPIPGQHMFGAPR